MVKKFLALSVAVFVMIMCLSSGCMMYKTPEKGPIAIDEKSYWLSENQKLLFYFNNLKIDKLCIYNGYAFFEDQILKMYYNLGYSGMTLFKDIKISYENNYTDEISLEYSWKKYYKFSNEYKWDDKFKAIVEEMDGYSKGDEIWFYRVSEEEYINFCIERGLNPFPFELLAI